MIALLLGLQVHGVVDRIDGGHAAIEWDGGPVVPVPLDRLPPGVCEGSAVSLRARPLSKRPAHLSRGPGEALPVPLEVVPRGWRAAAAKGTPVRWTITLERT